MQRIELCMYAKGTPGHARWLAVRKRSDFSRRFYVTEILLNAIPPAILLATETVAVHIEGGAGCQPNSVGRCT